jgi:hypothetical protein
MKNPERYPVSAAATTIVSEVPPERQHFKALLLSNSNYFGNLAKSPAKPVKKIVANTTYEELTCVGFNPAKNLLEATFAVKLPFGYGGNLCQDGTTEYVRFFVDYGSGWEDAGLAGVRVHDIPTGKDCASVANKPLIYVASFKLAPKTNCCAHPVLPKVHAILSWQWSPPAGAANVGWVPPWGNTLDCHIQIQPHPWNIFCLIEEINKGIPQKIKIPPLFEEAKLQPIPLPDPPPFNLAELAKMYSGQTKAATAHATSVESHRFGLSDLHAAAGPGGFNQELASAKAAEWKSLGLDWKEAVAALAKTNSNVSYEQIECLGLDDNLERLVATFRIKRPTGYSGDLCHAGSVEYVAFWADWENTCEWTYLDTVKVNVHDIASIPKEGLCYSAILPVDLTYHHRSCEKPKIGRVRAVLSWAVPPSNTNPDTLNYWGNGLDAHVQINPGDEIQPHKPLAKIRNLGGIPIEQIDTVGTGMTISGAVFAHNPGITADGWGQNRACPFGGSVQVEGYFYQGYYYRVKAHKIGDPPASFSVLADSFELERWDFGFDLQSATGGFFKYLNPALYLDFHLAYWSSSGDDMWEVQLDIATAPNEASVIASSPPYRIQLDNTGPVAPTLPPASPATIDIHITNIGGVPMAGDCKDVVQGDVIKGNFIADDLHFGAWSLSTEPNTVMTPSNQPQPDPVLAATAPAPVSGGHGWILDTANPVPMKPCGYVVRLDASDRSILHSMPFEHNTNHIEVGFCLRATKA